MAQQVVTELVIDARSAAAGAAAYEGAMKKAEAAAQRVVAVNDNAQAAIERSTVSMSQSTSRQAAAWQRVAAGADAVTAARQRLEDAERKGNAAMARGVATADEVASTLAVYRARLDAASAASVRGTAATALNSGQVQNLTFQLNDMATMLASGQSPFVMLMQQGMQMAQVFGPGVGLGGALKATGAALLSFITNPLTLAVAGMAAAAGAISLLWDAVSSSASAERALEEHKALIEDIRDAYGEAGEAATAYAAKSAEVLRFRTDNALSTEMKALKAALSDFATTNNPFEVYNPSQVAADFGPLNEMVMEFIRTISDGTADVAAFERALADVGNVTDDVQTDAAVAEVLALIDPLLHLERQALQTAGATQLFAGTLVTLGPAGTLRFADAFGDMDALRADLTGFLDEQNRAAEESARIATQQADAIKNVTGELTFEADQLARTAREQAIYNALRQAGTTLDTAAGREIAALAGNLYDAEQAQDALNKRMQEAKGLAEGFAGALVSGLIKGEGVVGSIANAVSSMSSSLGTMASDLLGKIGGGGMFGSILSGLGGGLVSSVVSGIGSIVDSLFSNPELDAWRAMKGEVTGLIKEMNAGTISIEQAKEQYKSLMDAAEAAGQSGAKVDRLTKAFEEFRKEAEKAEKAARKAALADTLQGYGDRAFVAGLDTATQAGRLAQFDLEAQRERERVIEEGGKKVNQKLAVLDQALAAERLQIQRDFNDQMVADAQAAADEMNRVGRSIADYVNGLNTGSDSPLSPQDRYTAASAAFQSQLALAQGGNVDAQSSITQYADAFLKASRDMFASSEQFQTDFALVKAALLALPAVQQSDDPVVQALLAAQNAIVSSVDLMRTTLNAAIDAGPAASAAALAPLFDTIDVNASGGITLAEMQTALGTTNARLQSIFTELDVNGSGTISRLELLAKDTSLGSLAKDASLGGLAKDATVTGVSKDNTLSTNLQTVATNLESVSSGLAGTREAINVMSRQVVTAVDNLGKAIDPNFQAGGGTGKGGKGGKGKNKAMGGPIDGYADGGMIGNGIYNVDSVAARYAGGGEIMLAGGEFVTRATSVNPMTMPILDAINRTGRPGGAVNDNGRYFADQNRVLMAGFRAMVEGNEALRAEVRALRAAVAGTTRAVKDKPVAKPATKTA